MFKLQSEKGAPFERKPLKMILRMCSSVCLGLAEFKLNIQQHFRFGRSSEARHLKNSINIPLGILKIGDEAVKQSRSGIFNPVFFFPSAA